MRISFYIHALFLIISCTAFAQDGWIWQNPSPQGNNLYDICSDPTHEGRYIAVGDYGTILVKDDHYIWYQMESGTKENLYSVCFSQTNGWIVGYNGTILHNSDGEGVVWTKQNSGTTKMLLSVYFTDFLHGWAVGQDETILYTTDIGETWNNISTGGTQHYFSVYFTDYLNGWIAGASGSYGIVKKTTDRGFSWSNSLIPTKRMNSIKFINDSVGCVVGDEGRIYTTGDRGNNWSPGTSNTTSDLKDVYLQDNGEGWAVGYNGTIIYTTDYGNNWTVQESPTANTLYGVEHDYAIGWAGIILQNEGTWVFESSGFTDNIYGIDFGADAARGFAVGEGGHILYTSDAGNSWTLQDSVTNLDLYAIDVISGKTGWIPVAIIVGQHGKVFYGSSNNWVDRSIPTTDHLYAAHRLWGGTAWVASEFGRVFKTTDHGRNWDLMHENMSYHLYAIHFTSKSYGYAAGMSGAVIKTTNGGEDWTDVSPNNLNIFRSIYFVDRSRGWVVGNDGAIFKTTDGGISWTEPAHKFTYRSLNAVKFTDENVGWIAGANGTILHTTNGGEDWYHQDSKGIGELRTMCFPEIGVGWIGGFDGLLLHTSDGGGTLTYKVYMKKYLELFIPDTGEINDTIDIGMSPGISDAGVVSGVTVIIDSLVHPDVSDLVLILSHEGITDTLIALGEISGSDIIQCQLTDASSLPIEDGEAPYADNFKPHVPLSAFYGLNPDGEWKLTVIDLVSGNAGILQSWGIKLFFEIPTGIEPELIELPHRYYVFQNYPNPFNPTTTIQFDIPEASLVTLKVYNILGQEVATLVNEKRQAGRHEVRLDGSKLTSGVYFYRLQTDNYTNTKKLLLLR